ncbi:helix-turn-helix transcriptional regulator, partial [Methylomonas koyamae]|uniref:helix-turn-helix transcriptional regulator n=1 Tax=Methylomonas koyamae TaxID=702114 RepID=UPI000A97F58F
YFAALHNDDLFLTLVQALFEQQRLLIQYHARGDDQTSQRPVSPQDIVLYKDNWYLDAYCHQREEPRTFALDRIKNATAIGEAAYLLDPATLQQHFGSAYGIFAGTPKHTAILNFSAKAGRWLCAATRRLPAIDQSISKSLGVSRRHKAIGS